MHIYEFSFIFKYELKVLDYIKINKILNNKEDNNKFMTYKYNDAFNIINYFYIYYLQIFFLTP